MPLIPYEDWSRRSRGATRNSHPIGATRGVTLHWEGPHMGAFPHSECAGKVRGIQDFHIGGRNWADIAYNALVCPHGSVFEGRGPGVTSAANGYTRANDEWYAVCYLGGERDPFTDSGKAGFIEAVAWLRTAGAAGPAVNGHRDHKPTECPGNEIYTWLHGRDWNQEDDMPYTESELRTIVREEVAGVVKSEMDELEKQLKVLRRAVRQQATSIRAKLRDQDVLLDEVEADVDAILELVSED